MRTTRTSAKDAWKTLTTSEVHFTNRGRHRHTPATQAPDIMSGWEPAKNAKKPAGKTVKLSGSLVVISFYGTVGGVAMEPVVRTAVRTAMCASIHHLPFTRRSSAHTENWNIDEITLKGIKIYFHNLSRTKRCH